MDSFITGELASGWLVLPTMLVCITIYQHKKVNLSHVYTKYTHGDVQSSDPLVSEICDDILGDTLWDLLVR